MNLTTAHEKLRHRVAELRDCCTTGSPWVFLGASAFIEYLAKLAGLGYKEFISSWLAQVRPEYSTFTYKCGESDLPVQMYHVLRCGIVHSLSLIPDQRARDEGGRDRSIALCHRSESQQMGFPHLSSCMRPGIPDAALFVAEDFVDDLDAVMNKLFIRAGSDPALESQMTSWLGKHPFISGGF